MARELDDDMLLDKENFDDEDEGGGKKKGKMMTSLIALFIVIIWIAIFALLIKLDVGGFGSSVLYPVLKDVPVLNKILPGNVTESVSTESGNTYTNLEDAINRINELENEIAIYKQNADDNAQTISSLTAELKRLQAYEENQTYYEQLKKKFDTEVVYTDNAPDIQSYKEWYEEIEPENAETIYRQVIEQLEKDQVIQDLASYYSTMKPDAAAKVFEEMTGDLERVAQILSCMKPANAANILASMDSTLAAKLTLLIYPTEE